MATTFSRPWLLQEASMLQQQARGGYCQVGRYVYVLGGSNGAGAIVADVQRGRIDDDGRLKDWVFDTPIPTPTALGNAFADRGYVYLVNGNNPSNPTANIFFSKVGGDGGLGLWQATTPLPVPNSQQGIVVDRAHHRVYSFGGTSTGGVTLLNCYVADIGSDGQLSAWRTLPPYPEPGMTGAFQMRGVVYEGYLYTSLGYDGGSPGPGFNFFTTIWSAKISPSDGSLGPWVAVGSFPGTRIRCASYLVDDIWVVTGGSQVNLGTTSFPNTYQVRLTGGGGVIGQGVDLGNPQAEASYTPFQAQWKRWLFCFGGNTDSSHRTQLIQRAEADL